LKDRLNKIVKNNTGFRSFDELINASGHYTPTIDIGRHDMRLLAEAYDAVQEALESRNRCHRRTCLNDPAAKITLAEYAAVAKLAGQYALGSARKQYGGVIRTQMEVVGVADNGLGELERVTSSEYYNYLSELTGKNLRETIENANFSKEQFTHVWIVGDLDWYENLYAMTKGGAECDRVGYWGTEIEVSEIA